MKTINTQISRGRQHVYFEKIIQSTSNTIRVSISSDSIKNQCHARVYVFNFNLSQWNILYQLYNLTTPAGLTHYIPLDQEPSILLHYFRGDEKHLVEMAEQILQDKFTKGGKNAPTK